MSELDGFDELELDLSAHGAMKSRTTKRIRAGRRLMKTVLARNHDRPKWRLQLQMERGWDAKRGRS